MLGKRRSIAALVTWLTLSAAPTIAAAQTTDATKLEEARKHMQAGALFYNDPSGHKCEEAYSEFKKAFDLSGSANPLKGMAVCSLELERDADAIAEYERYLSLKGKQVTSDERSQIENDLKTLRAALAHVTLKADRADVKVTDVRTPQAGYPITNHYVAATDGTTIGLHPGLHTFTASVEGKPDLVWKIEVTNGATLDHTFDFSKVKAPDAAPQPMVRPVPKAVYVAGGLTIALAIPTVIMGVRALGKSSDFKAANGAVPAADATVLHDDVKSANLVADVFLGVTAAALVTTGVLYFTRPSRPAAPTTGWIITPTPNEHGGGATLRATF
jgi:hypothetical protein